MDDAASLATARWLAEALETGNPLAPLPEELSPRTMADGEEIAAALLDTLGLVACGVRLAPGPTGIMVAGPVVETRLLPNGATVSLAGLRHAQATAAVVGVLAEDLPEHGEGLPALAALHPAIDIAASRFSSAPDCPALVAADLGGLGLVVVGRRAPPALQDTVPVSLAPAGRRPRGVPLDLRAALSAAATAARRMGGLPARALLVAAGLSPALQPVSGEEIASRFGPLGHARLRFA